MHFRKGAKEKCKSATPAPSSSCSISVVDDVPHSNIICLSPPPFPPDFGGECGAHVSMEKNRPTLWFAWALNWLHHVVDDISICRPFPPAYSLWETKSVISLLTGPPWLWLSFIFSSSRLVLVGRKKEKRRWKTRGYVYIPGRSSGIKWWYQSLGCFFSFLSNPYQVVCPPSQNVKKRPARQRRV